MRYPKNKWLGKTKKKGSSKSYVLALWAKYIKKRDGNCQLCGSPYGCESHHIIKKGIYSHTGWYLPENGIYLCHNHHYGGIHDSFFPRVKENQGKINEWLKRRGTSYNALYLKCKSGRIDLELSKIVLKTLLSDRQ
jgi:hypothetical protein